MAERTVTVRLKAVVDDYKRAMAGAKDATTSVVQQADNWQKLGRSTADLGDRMTRNITLPIIAVGAAAVKMAADFDNSFVQMQTLAGVSAGEVEGLKESVLGLAGETGRAPQELAEALYFIQSAGLGGAAAVDALEASAKGAAAGLGSTIQVADAVTNAINGYGAANITASEATDVLVATAREGKAEASELAPQFGRLIPVAAELGISFDQLGGGMAFLTRASGDTSLAATQMSGVMAKLIEPGVEGAAALAKAGMSADELRASVREKGLYQALVDLRDNLEASGQSLNDFSIDQQFLQGALQITGASAEEAKDVFEALEDSTGATESAFETWAESMGAENAQAFAKFQVALIKLGDVLLPIASDVMGFVASIVEAFSGLPEPVQKAFLAFMAFAAALGPIMSVGGRLIDVYGMMQRALENLANSSSPAARNMGQLAGSLGRLGGYLAIGGAVIGGLILLRETLGSLSEPASAEELSHLESQLLDLGQTGEVTGQQLTEVMERFREGPGEPRDWGEYQQAFSDLDDALAQLVSRDPQAAAASFDEVVSMIAESTGASAERVREVFDTYAAALAEVDTAAETAAGGLGDTTDEITDQATAMETASGIAQEYIDTLTAMFDPLFGMANALGANRDAQQAVTDAQGALNDAVAQFGPNSAEAAAAQRDLDDAMLGAGSSALDVMSATAQLNAQVAANPALLQQAKQSLETWVAQGLISQAVADNLGAQFDSTAAQARELGKTDPKIDITASGASATVGTLGWVKRETDNLDGVRATVYVHVVATGPAAASIASGKRMQHGGRVSAHMPYMVGEEGEELFVPDVPGTVVPNHMLGSMMPSPISLAGGVSETHVHLYMQGAIISSQSQFDRMVVRAVRRAGEAGMPITVRGRRV
jgi:TP901 family phage tail tape measure protein